MRSKHSPAVQGGPVVEASGKRSLANEGENTLCYGKVIRIRTEDIRDARGILSPIEFSHYNFHPVRSFVITAPSGAIRGGHCHKRARQLLMVIAGEIEIEARYWDSSVRFKLDCEHRAVLIEPLVWSRQTYYGDSPAMVVFSDTPYDASDYDPCPVITACPPSEPRV